MNEVQMERSAPPAETTKLGNLRRLLSFENTSVSIAVMVGLTVAAAGLMLLSSTTGLAAVFIAGGATIGGSIGVFFGSSIGIATAGIGLAATIPLGLIGAALGGLTGLVLSLAILGAVAVASGLIFLASVGLAVGGIAYKFGSWIASRRVM